MTEYCAKCAVNRLSLVLLSSDLLLRFKSFLCSFRPFTAVSSQTNLASIPFVKPTMTALKKPLIVSEVNRQLVCATSRL